MTDKPKESRKLFSIKIKTLHDLMEVSAAAAGVLTVAASAVIYVATVSAKTDEHTIRLDKQAIAIKEIKQNQEEFNMEMKASQSRLEGKVDVLLERTK